METQSLLIVQLCDYVQILCICWSRNCDTVPEEMFILLDLNKSDQVQSHGSMGKEVHTEDSFAV